MIAIGKSWLLVKAKLSNRPKPLLKMTSRIVRAKAQTPIAENMAPTRPWIRPSSMNGIRMNQLVAPTNRITSTSRLRANSAVLIVLYINNEDAKAEANAAMLMVSDAAEENWLSRLM